MLRDYQAAAIAAARACLKENDGRVWKCTS